MFKDFINTYTVSGISYFFSEEKLKILLVLNNDGTIGFPGGKEAIRDEGSIIKTFERELAEEVPSWSKLILGEKNSFYQIVKKRDDDERKEMIHHFLMIKIKNNHIPFENNQKEFFVSWKDIFFIENLRKTTIAGLTAFLFKLKEEKNNDQSLNKMLRAVYDKNDDLHNFYQALQIPDNKGNIPVRNHLALNLLEIKENQLKPY